MSSRRQIIRNVRVHDVAQPAFIGDDDVIEALAANRADQPLRVRVLPRRARRGEDFLDAERRRRRRPCVERRISIVDQIARRLVPRKRLAELLRRPRRRRMVRNCDMHDTAPLMREDDENEQEPARGRRNNEEVGRRNLLEMVGEERSRFAMVAWCLDGRCIL